VTGAFDVAVVGSGFAGSLAALLARRAGRSVALIERGAHPRFAIGESSSPLANLLLEELSDRYDLPRIRPLAAWGSWQRAYPEVGCGLKRGFTFYGHEAGRPFGGDPERRDQLLVAASPNDEVADTHWYRADFDRFLAEEAAAEGAEYLDRTEILGISHASCGFDIAAERGGRRMALRARFVIDASGPGGFLHRALGLETAAFPDLPETEGLFAHFEGVRRLDRMGIFPSADRPPYPADDAALHHVFDGGWIWVLRFANGITSAGVAATPSLARELRLSEGEPAWARLLARFPTVRDQFESSRTTRPFLHRPRLPFRSRSAAGPGWALLPSAAAFVDPLLSTGFPLALLGLERLARAMREDWGRPSFDDRLAHHGARTLSEADAAALLVSALYARFHDFPVFAALTLLYFAAASYAESARRLGRPVMAGAFLSADHPRFGPGLVACCRLALDGGPGGRDALLAAIRETIEPLDVIGLSDTSRRNWFPVDPADLYANARKLGATQDEIAGMLRRAGLAPDAVEATAR
jgi:tetracycline 7-halogenase / FADH2 O2-dependent halogenase